MYAAAAAGQHRRPFTAGSRWEQITVGSTQERRIYRRFNKIKGALEQLWETVLEARKANIEQNDRLVKLDLIMDNMIKHFCDPEMM